MNDYATYIDTKSIVANSTSQFVNLSATGNYILATNEGPDTAFIAFAASSAVATLASQVLLPMLPTPFSRPLGANSAAAITDANDAATVYFSTGG